jgi:hypothetical protein
VKYYLFRAGEGTLRPGEREGIERVCWFPIPSALDHIHRHRVRQVADQASRLLEYLGLEK